MSDDRENRTVTRPAMIDGASAVLTTPVTDLRHVHPRQAELLARLEIATVADLLRHLPSRYEEVMAETPIGQLTPGALVTARGEVRSTRPVMARGRGGKPRFQAVLMDHTGRLDLVWFNGLYLRDKIAPGMRLRVTGEGRRFGPGGAHIQIVNPKFEVLPDDPEVAEPAARGAWVRPVYPATEGLSSDAIGRIIGKVIAPDGAESAAIRSIDDHLSAEYRDRRGLPELRAAYMMAHRPESLVEADEARRRLAYDELLLLQLGVYLRREELRRTTCSLALRWSEAIDRHIRERFPFTLTEAQDGVIREIVADLTKAAPTNRLIQGDVGSGKTVVALYAMLLAVASRHQAALMAPTELLAEQHARSIAGMLSGSNIRVGLLTGAVSGREREAILSGIGRGDIDIAVGTHALLTEGVRFDSLAVAVIDEQHRFGVHQRATLKVKHQDGREHARMHEHQRSIFGERTWASPAAHEKRWGDEVLGGQSKREEAGRDFGVPVLPHTLVMTATPIPRTLALTLFGDLDVSTIRSLPPGRTPIITKVVTPEQSEEVYRWARGRIEAGEQVYVVVPAIDTGAAAVLGSVEVGAAEAESAINDLRTVQARLESEGGAFAGGGVRVAGLHGRMSGASRDAVMTRFRAGEIDALVATTVIEVGVDVPNATVMVVEHAERFGLAQLHQLRGRVGRGSKRSVCVLIAHESGPEAAARVKAMVDTTDGFVLAERDLEMRGPGEVFGLRQAGAPPFRVADLMRDRELLVLARRDAAAWIEASPSLDRPEDQLIRRRLLKAHGRWLGLGDVG